jgi:putative transposase
MATRKISFVTGEYYHLYTRGIEKRIIFLDAQDYDYFIFLMHVCNTKKSIRMKALGEKFERGETIVDIGTYCLMPNHVHILAYEKIEKGISTYMLKLLTAYSMYFNLKYKRTGRLYESTFKSSHAGDDRYLKYLYAYIHLNPAKLIDKNWKENPTKSSSVLWKFVSEYKYSSLQEYLKTEVGLKRKIINASAFPAYFETCLDHKKDLFSWLEPLQG